MALEGGDGGRLIIVKYAQSLLYNKGLLPWEKTCPEPYPIWGNDTPPSTVSSSLPISPNVEKKPTVNTGHSFKEIDVAVREGNSDGVILLEKNM